MKLCKSILSPARPARDASLSRRLKAGQALPFFTTRKKKGCAFDNPEPSSPKVTCIGQVRVVDKVVCSNASAHYQQGCAAHHRNQKWVHLPVSICEALSSFSCLFPCKCFSTTHRDSKQRNDSGSGARWLVSLNDAEGGKKREIELVVGVGDEEELVAERVPMKRRHVFEDIEVKDDRIEMKGRGEAARVSIGIPPKNALLLMRCRSDPIKMKIGAQPARLSSRDAPAPQTIVKDNKEEHEFNGEKRDLEENVSTEEEEEEEEEGEEEEEEENPDESDVEASSKLEQEEKLATAVEEMVQRGIEEALQCECIPDHEEEVVESSMSSFEALSDQEITEPSENCPVDEDGKDEVEQDIPICQHEATVEEEHQATNDQENNNMIAQAPDPEIVTSRYEEEAKLQKPAAGMPECLLLMMCEPKLSIEVSKETWVCSTDFIRCLPDRPRRLSIDSKPKKAAAIIPEVQQPPRSSCTLPVMTAMIEQKPVNAVGYEPFVLTRCKSEPMRTAATKLGSESFFWKLAQPRLSSARLELDSKPSRQKMMRAGS